MKWMAKIVAGLVISLFVMSAFASQALASGEDVLEEEIDGYEVRLDFVEHEAQTGHNQIRIVIHDPQGQPVNNASVTVSVLMREGAEGHGDGKDMDNMDAKTPKATPSTEHGASEPSKTVTPTPPAPTQPTDHKEGGPVTTPSPPPTPTPTPTPTPPPPPTTPPKKKGGHENMRRIEPAQPTVMAANWSGDWSPRVAANHQTVDSLRAWTVDPASSPASAEGTEESDGHVAERGPDPGEYLAEVEFDHPGDWHCSVTFSIDGHERTAAFMLEIDEDEGSNWYIVVAFLGFNVGIVTLAAATRRRSAMTSAREETL